MVSSRVANFLKKRKEKDVQQILLSYFACSQIWLNVQVDHRHFWLQHKIDKNYHWLGAFNTP
jgi:hypothetical protein